MAEPLRDKDFLPPKGKRLPPNFYHGNYNEGKGHTKDDIPDETKALANKNSEKRYLRELEVLRLRTEEGLSWRAVGERMGLTRHTVQELAVNALKRTSHHEVGKYRQAFGEDYLDDVLMLKKAVQEGIEEEMENGKPYYKAVRAVKDLHSQLLRTRKEYRDMMGMDRQPQKQARVEHDHTVIWQEPERIIDVESEGEKGEIEDGDVGELAST